jgi:hypothetical protein
MKRYRNGRFKSKRDYEIECKTRNYTIMITFLTTLVFSIAFHPWTGTYQSLNIDTKTANAQEIQDEIEPASTEPVYTDKVQQAINEIPHTSSTTEAWIAYIYEYADKQGKNGDRASHVIWCETQFMCTQSNIVKNGVREASYCLGQLHAPSHPELTWEQLNDPYFNIRYVIDVPDKWFAYNESTDSCTNGVLEYWK